MIKLDNYFKFGLEFSDIEIKFKNLGDLKFNYENGTSWGQICAKGTELTAEGNV